MAASHNHFIRTPSGSLMLFLIILISFFSFLGAFDITPPAFAINEDRPKGIYVMDPDTAMLIGEFFKPFGMAVMVAGIMLGASLGVYRLTDSIDFNSDHSIIYWGFFWLLFMIIYIAIFYVIAHVSGIVNTSRESMLRSAPLMVRLFIFSHSGLISLLAVIYQRTLLPPSLFGSDRDSVVVYMENQRWFGRLLIAVSLAFVVGISIPLTFNFTNDTPAILPLLFIWGTYLTPLLGITVFFLFRVKACQDMLLNTVQLPWWRYR